MAQRETPPGRSALPPHLRHIDPAHATTKKVVKELVGDDGANANFDELAEAKDIDLLLKNFFAELEGPRCPMAKRDKDLLRARLTALKDKDPAKVRELVKRERQGFAPPLSGARLSETVHIKPEWESPPSLADRLLFWIHRIFRRHHFDGRRLKPEVFAELENIQNAYHDFAPGWSHLVDHLYNDEFFPPLARGPRSPEVYNLMALLSPDQLGRALSRALEARQDATAEERVRSLDSFARIYLTLNHKSDRERQIAETVKALAKLLEEPEKLREVSRRSCLLTSDELRELATAMRPFFHHRVGALPVMDLLLSCYSAHFRRTLKRADLEKMFKADAPIESHVKVLGPSARACLLADLGAVALRKREAEQDVAFWGEAQVWAQWGEAAWETLAPPGAPEAGSGAALHEARVAAFVAFWKPLVQGLAVLPVQGSAPLALFHERRAEFLEYLGGLAMGEGLAKMLAPMGAAFPPGPDLAQRSKAAWNAYQAKAGLYAWNLVELFGHELQRLPELDPELPARMPSDTALVKRVEYWFLLGATGAGPQDRAPARPLVEMNPDGETTQYPPYSVFALLQSGRCMALHLARFLGYEGCLDIPGNIKAAVRAAETSQSDLAFLGGSGAQ